MKENEKNTKYYLARINAINSVSRQQASKDMNIDVGRLLRIELGRTTAYPEEICKMAEEYSSPDLTNYYCSHECPIGKKTVPYIEKPNVYKNGIQLLSVFNKSKFIGDELTDILDDGEISISEEERIENIDRYLDEIIKRASAMKLANALRKIKR